MKIRCEQNSLRLRLRKSELVQLRAEHWLESGLHFPDGQGFCWELVLDPEAADVAATFSTGRLSVQVPAPAAQQWMDSDDVAIEAFLTLGDGTALHVLIEKDFPCKDQPEEDKSDYFTELADDAPVKC